MSKSFGVPIVAVALLTTACSSTSSPSVPRTFTAGTRLAVPLSSARRPALQPRFLRVKFHYLDQAREIEPWLGSAPPAQTDEETLFKTWVEHIAAVVTNALPIRWGSGPPGPAMPGAMVRNPGGF